MTVVLWELHSPTELSARCAYRHDPPGAHIVSVTVGEVVRFHEKHATEADAHEEAGHLLAHFMLDGWTTVMYCDSRITLP